MKTEADIKNATLGSTNLSFDFTDTVRQWATGIAYLYYTFGNEDHHVQDIKAQIGSTSNGDSVSVNVTMTMKDNGNNGLAGDSQINVACLAATGSNTTSNLVLSSGLSFKSGESSNSVSLDNNTFSNQAIMSGFEMSYGNTDHHIKRMHGNVYVTNLQQGKSAQLSGTCDMYDDSGHSATTKTLEGAYLGTYINGAGSGIVSKEVSYKSNLQTQEVDMGVNFVGKPVVFLKSFDLSFSGDHHMKYIKIGASNVTRVEGTNKVSFLPWARMYDDSGNEATGSVDLVIVVTTTPTDLG